jgi:hypothetical protein
VSLVPVPGFRRDPWAWGVFLAVMGSLTIHVPLLVYPDLIQSYPFYGGDTADWLANGLHWAGLPVCYTVRPPLLPWIIAGLTKLGLLQVLPLVLVLATHLTALVGFAALRRRAPPWIAAVVVGALLWNHALLGESCKIHCDTLAASLLCLATMAFLGATTRPHLYLVAGILAGASALTQQAAVLVGPAVAVVTLLHRRHHLRSAWLWGGATACVVPPSAWMIGKLVSYGTISGVGPIQWALLKPHLSSVTSYAWAAASLLGLPGLLLLAAGAVLALSRLRSDETSLLALVHAPTVLAFFVLLYDFFDARFLVYAILPAAVLMAEGLARLPRRYAVVASALVVGWSLAPNPGFGADAASVTLWPFPSVCLHAGTQVETTGAMALLPATARLETATLRDQLAFSHLGRLIAMRRAAPPPQPGIWARYGGAHSGLLVVRRSSDIVSRYHTPTDLGNRLGIRVKVVPLAALAPAGGALEMSLAQHLGAWDIYRATVRGLPGAWWLILQAGPNGEALAQELTFRGAGGDPAPAAQVERARRMLEATASRYQDMPLGIVPVYEKPDPALPYLALLATTAKLYIPDHSEVPAARSLLARLTHDESIAADGAVLLRTHLMGEEVAVIDLGGA